MIRQSDITDRIAPLLTLLEERAGVQAESFGDGWRRALRGMPGRVDRRLRRQADLLARAEQVAAHPRLARQIDPAALSAAVDAIKSYLGKLDPWERRKDKALRLAAAVAFPVLVAATGFVVWLWWQGYV